MSNHEVREFDQEPENAYAARIERNAAMFLAALISTQNDMTHRDEVKLALTYAEMLADEVDRRYVG